MHEPTMSPIACRMAPQEQRARRQDLDANLFSGADAIRELEDGYAFRFPGSPEWIDRLLSFIKVERDCCPFFTFELSFGPDQGPVWFRMRGPDGTKAFIEQLLRSEP